MLLQCFSFSLWRYELPAPSAGQKNDISAWQECVNNSMAQLEHQAVRIENLELMSQFGTNAWKVYNEYVARGPMWQHTSKIIIKTDFYFSFSFSNLAFMIETAQKEIQRLRWAITLQKCGYNTFCVFNIHVILGGTRKQIQDINWQRKNEQLTGGAKLRELESKYVCLYGVFLFKQDACLFLFCFDINICLSTAGCLWSVRTMRSSGPLSSWRTK